MALCSAPCQTRPTAFSLSCPGPRPLSACPQLACSLSVANAFLIESPQVVYLLVEIKAGVERAGHLHSCRRWHSLSVLIHPFLACVCFFLDISCQWSSRKCHPPSAAVILHGCLLSRPSCCFWPTLCLSSPLFWYRHTLGARTFCHTLTRSQEKGNCSLRSFRAFLSPETPHWSKKKGGTFQAFSPRQWQETCVCNFQRSDLWC